MANPRVIERGSKEYKRLVAVAKMFEAFSPNEASYTVEDVYFDLGQNWKWTTICRSGFRDCQVLNPVKWSEILLAEDSQELAYIAESIRRGKYFGDA